MRGCFVERRIIFKLDNKPGTPQIRSLELGGNVHKRGDGYADLPNEPLSEMRSRPWLKDKGWGIELGMGTLLEEQRTLLEIDWSQ